MKFAATIVATFFLFQGTAQIVVRDLDTSMVGKLLPRGEHLKGAYEWRDIDGKQWLVCTQRKASGHSSEAGESLPALGLHMRHYHILNTGPKLDWQVADSVPPCSLDLIAGVLPGGISITDLNGDGYAEVWMAYMLVCTGDVSPIPMKEIMYERGKKYAIRGTSRVQTNENSIAGGETKADSNFQNGPNVFKSHAIKDWEKFKMISVGSPPLQTVLDTALPMANRDTSIKYSIDGLTAEGSEVDAHYKNGNLDHAVWHLYGETAQILIRYNFLRNQIQAEEKYFGYRSTLSEVKSKKDLVLKKDFRYVMDLHGKLITPKPTPDFENSFASFAKEVAFHLVQ